jgi:hypothetical protein
MTEGNRASGGAATCVPASDTTKGEESPTMAGAPAPMTAARILGMSVDDYYDEANREVDAGRATRMPTASWVSAREALYGTAALPDVVRGMDLRIYAAEVIRGDRDAIPTVTQCAELWGVSRSVARRTFSVEGLGSITKGRSVTLPAVDLPDGSPPFGVYFIQGRITGLVKIGHSTDVRHRVRSLQTGSPDILRVLAVVPGGVARERLYHGDLAPHRAHGEWFRPHPDVMAAAKGGGQ